MGVQNDAGHTQIEKIESYSVPGCLQGKPAIRRDVLGRGGHGPRVASCLRLYEFSKFPERTCTLGRCCNSHVYRSRKGITDPIDHPRPPAGSDVLPYSPSVPVFTVFGCI